MVDALFLYALSFRTHQGAVRDCMCKYNLLLVTPEETSPVG